MNVHKGNQMKSRNHQIFSVLERFHFPFPQNTHIRGMRDLHFDVNSNLYSLEHTHKSSNLLGFWSTDFFSFPSGRTKTPDVCQRSIRMDPVDQTCALHWVPHAGHHIESTCNHFFPLKKKKKKLALFYYARVLHNCVVKMRTQIWAAKHSSNSHCKRNINFSIHQTILPPNE